MKPRKSFLKRSAIKRKHRKPSEFKRIYGSPARVRWVALHTCARCGAMPSENAHIENGGMGRKADADKIVPLCRECHTQFHCWGRANFEHIHHIDLDAFAAETERSWQATKEEAL